MEGWSKPLAIRAREQRYHTAYSVEERMREANGTAGCLRWWRSASLILRVYPELLGPDEKGTNGFMERDVYVLGESGLGWIPRQTPFSEDETFKWPDPR